jgi:phage terminase large subunit-like protein
MGYSLKHIFRTWDHDTQERFLADLAMESLVEMARGEWWWEARPEQIPPLDLDWLIHLYLGGRGTGKTRSGGEWIVDRSEKYPLDVFGVPTERLVIAPTLSDARDQCIEGPSGIARVLERRGIDYHYTKSPKPQIILKATESRIHFIGSDPDKARGFNLADVWMDEIIKWGDARKTWLEGVLPALRMKIPGDHPRAFVTTTPKAIRLLIDWVEKFEHERDQARRGQTVKHTISMSTGSTYDNAENLSEEALQGFIDTYEGTDLGEQELHGRLMLHDTGKLFHQSTISKYRVEIGPLRVRARVVGVDPSLTGDGADHQDEMGVAVLCADERDHIYVLADESQYLSGHAAALHIWRVFATWEADMVVYEDNLGKAWMKKVLVDAYEELREAGLFPAESTPPLKSVHSNQGKKTRAERLALRYQQGRAHHVGVFETLERQQVTFDPESSSESPDRMDAVVHGANWLMDGEKKRIRVASPTNRRVSGAAPMRLPANGYSFGLRS